MTQQRIDSLTSVDPVASQAIYSLGPISGALLAQCFLAELM